jgi:hypothetical protein
LQARADVDELNEMYADSARHEYADVAELEDRARRHALWANIGFGAAAAAAIASGVLFLRSGDEGASDAAAVTPIAGADAVGVAFALPF